MPETYLSDRQIGERFGVHHLTPRRWVREDPTFPRELAPVSNGHLGITMEA